MLCRDWGGDGLKRSVSASSRFSQVASPRLLYINRPSSSFTYKHGGNRGHPWAEAATPRLGEGKAAKTDESA